LLAALPGVAKEVLDEAPRREGIRVTAWWQQTREEIVDDVRRSIEALHALDALAGFVPLKFEQRFGGERPLQLIDEGDSFSLRGVIDRVDRAADGRLCIIDYKTAGSTSYTHRDVNEGKKMQLPLYGLAARDALGLGEPADGFYWHVRDAKPSSFTLGKFRKKEGRSAMAVAAEKAWETVRAVRQGHFQPCPPDSGCPSYCPAAGFCWCLMERFGG
jgi:RecB family exonuclease